MAIGPLRAVGAGIAGDKVYDAFEPAAAYNSTDDQYLVVWRGDDPDGLVDGEYEIFGQRMDGVTGGAIGSDIRLSDMGPDGDPDYGAFSPAVAYNSANNEYLVVWYGDDDTAGLADDEYEIFAQRVSGATGAEVGPDLRLSEMGPDGDPAYGAANPAVAYNSASNQYLVVWHGDDDAGGLVDDELEIFAQRVAGPSGLPIGADQRLSDMGPAGEPNYDAVNPAVAHNNVSNQYLVVWQGDDSSGRLADGEMEIFAQRLEGATGFEIEADFRLSAMGPDGDPNYDAFSPAVAHNSADNEYLVVWHGDESAGGGANDEYEIYGQRIAGVTGAEIGTDIRLSEMGSDGDPNFDAFDPDVSYNGVRGQYLVVWRGDDPAEQVDGEYEIFGQRVEAATGAQIGMDFRLSDMGPDGDGAYGAFSPAVVFNEAANEYLLVWQGDDDTGVLVEGEYEIFAQRVGGSTGVQISSDFRLSDMGLDSEGDFDAFDPAVAYNSTDNEYLVVWHGDDTTAGLVDDEYEIFGQRVEAFTGLEIGSDFRLSDMGPDGDPDYDAFSPAVAYNSTDNQYLVVWYGDDNTEDLADGEFEIFGQLVDGTTGAEIALDFRLSVMGPEGSAAYGAFNPAIAYNDLGNEYLVVWHGDDNMPGLVNEELEVFGMIVNTAGVAEPRSGFRLSEMGPDGDPRYDAFNPAVAFNSLANEYLVVWRGDTDTGRMADDEFEIFGQRIRAGTGLAIGRDIRYSHMGTDGNPIYDALAPAVAYNAVDDQFLVVWAGDDSGGRLSNDEFEIFGQRVEGVTGAEIGSDVRLSDMGPDGDPSYDALSPGVSYNSFFNEYMVVWRGDDNAGEVVESEFEIFGQRVAGATGAEIGADFRLSDMGPNGDRAFGAFQPAVVYGALTDEYFVVWNGDHNTEPLVEGDFEAFGQRLVGATGAAIGPALRLSDMGPDG